MAEKQLTYLYEATKIVPKTQCGTFLRCQLLSKCHALNYINLPAQNFKTSIMCQGCGIELADVPPSTTLKSPPKPTKLIKRIQRAVKKNKPVTTHLANIYTSFNKNNYQQLITKCQLCGKKNIVKMRKPNRQTPPTISPSQLQNKSKKKKKNLYAGLKKSAVLSVSTNNSTNKSKNKPYKINAETSDKQSDKNSIVPTSKQNTTENNNRDNVIDFIPLDMPSTSMIITKSVSSDNRNVNIVKNNNNITFKKGLNSNLATQNQNNVPSSNKKKSKNKKNNKCKSGRVQKNEVLKKTEKNMKKNDKNIKNLTKMLHQKENTTSSLANFLKNF